MKRTTFLAASGATAVLAAVPGRARASADLTLTTPTGNLAGTLEVPPGAGVVPAVLIIAGSGPTDRDGNTAGLPGKSDAYKLLALGLAARGIASLRYDKRSIGASAAAGHSESELRFDMLVDDAVAWIAHLRADKRFSRVVVAGHSEGSLIGMLAVARGGGDGFISLEGVGHPAAVLLRQQLAKLADTKPELAAQVNHALDELSAGRTVSDVDAQLASLFRPGIQPYLISWFKYDPAVEIARLRAPAAIVQGTADIQTRVGEGEALHAALPAARYVVIEGMNHVLKHAPDTSPEALMKGYTDPTLPVEPAVIDAVAAIAKSA